MLHLMFQSDSSHNYDAHGSAHTDHAEVVSLNHLSAFYHQSL